MRINSGRFKYRKLEIPESARPTTEKVREAVFSMLIGKVEGATVLDLFAGSGSLGLEALSRGAEFCVFNEGDRKNYKILKNNIVRLTKFLQHIIMILEKLLYLQIESLI